MIEVSIDGLHWSRFNVLYPSGNPVIVALCAWSLGYQHIRFREVVR